MHTSSIHTKLHNMILSIASSYVHFLYAAKLSWALSVDTCAVHPLLKKQMQLLWRSISVHHVAIISCNAVPTALPSWWTQKHGNCCINAYNVYSISTVPYDHMCSTFLERLCTCNTAEKQSPCPNWSWIQPGGDSVGNQLSNVQAMHLSPQLCYSQQLLNCCGICASWLPYALPPKYAWSERGRITMAWCML